jgi:hypothetical protein
MGEGEMRMRIIKAGMPVIMGNYGMALVGSIYPV